MYALFPKIQVINFWSLQAIVVNPNTPEEFGKVASRFVQDFFPCTFYWNLEDFRKACN